MTVVGALLPGSGFVAAGYRRMIFTRHLASGGAHTLEIRPLGDGRVTVDAFVVLP